MSTTDTPTAAAAPPLALVLQALAPFGFGYLLSYLFRAANAVVAPDLVKDIGLTAAELGLLTAAYLLAFALFQLPLGILLDRYGPRRVQSALLMVAAAGAVLFGLGQSVTHLALARALIGIGVAGSLMSGFKAVVLWVPEPRRPLANSCVMSLGAIGLLVSTTPFEWAVQLSSWRAVFVGLSVITALVAASILVVVPERPVAGATDTLGDQLRAVGRIYADRAFWGLAPLLATTAGVHIALQTLWAGPWFRDVAGLDRAGVAESLFVMAVAFFVGILVSGAIADWFVRRGYSVLTVMLGFLACYLVAQALIVANHLPLLAWFVFGMSGQVAILAYPWLSGYFGAKLSGRANTAMNLLIFLAAFLAQAAAGAVIDLYPRTASGGYPEAAYRAAFGGFLALQVLALAWYGFNWRRLHGPRSGSP